MVRTDLEREAFMFWRLVSETRAAMSPARVREHREDMEMLLQCVANPVLRARCEESIDRCDAYLAAEAA